MSRAKWQARLGAMGLRARLAAGTALLMTLLLAIASLALWQGEHLGGQLEHIVVDNHRRGELAHALHAALLDLQVQERSFIVLTEPDDLADGQRRFDASRLRYVEAEEALAAALQGDLPALASMREALTQAHQFGKQVEPVIDSALAAAAQGRGAEAAITVLLPAEGAQQRWAEQVRRIVDLVAQTNAAEAERLRSDRRDARAALLALTVVALGTGAMLAAALLRSVMLPVRQAMQVAERIAEGQLDSEVPTPRRDEFGRLLAAIATMQQALRSTVTGLRTSAHAVDGASREIAAGSLALAQRTEHAAARLQDTAAVLRELTGAVLESAQAAQAANEIAQRSRTEASRGHAAVALLEAGMSGIADGARRITDIVDSIDAIAFRTNMLALNAAVEAARAGDAGRGFAVVAEEVRQLAQRAAAAAGDIRRLSAAAADSVAQGQRHAADTGSAVRGLVETSEHVARTVHDVAGAAALQGERLRRIDASVAELDERTQHNAALVEELSAGAAGLQLSAAELIRSVGHFRLDADADGGSADPISAASKT